LPDEWRHPFSPRPVRRDPSTRILIAGAVAIGVGLLTWHYLGPDLKRYLKIYNM
jgi:hypothetical protein